MVDIVQLGFALEGLPPISYRILVVGLGKVMKVMGAEAEMATLSDEEARHHHPNEERMIITCKRSAT